MPAQRDVFFVVLDSARVDRLSAYGHDRPTTPTLDRLADEATRYESAFTTTPWTLPSHCSFFTGLFPSEHGNTNGFSDHDLRLPDAVETLPERLGDRGYRTAGFSNNPWVGQLSALDRGFDEFVEWDLAVSRDGDAPIHARRHELYDRAHALLGRAAGQPHALLKRRFFTSSLVERARRWLAHTDGDGRPTFTFMNLMEAHSPYYPPKRAFRELGLEPPSALEARLLNVDLLAYTMGKRSLTPARRERALDFYDASLRYQDAKLQELFSQLREQGRYDDALVVVCADHGKTLGEYDRDATPPHYLRNVNTHVPLLVKWPGQETADRVDDPFELRQLFALVTEGERGDAPATDVAMIEEFVPHTGHSTEPVTRWRGVTDGESKFVRSEDGAEHLLAGRGLSETVDDGHGERRSRLRDALDRRVGALSDDAGAERTNGSEETMDRNVQSQLEDLGYLG
jgi:choline-sulfatase